MVLNRENICRTLTTAAKQMMIASAIGAATDCKVDWRTPRYTERYEGCKLVSRRPNGRLCHWGLSRLEPCAVKVASTVLRGLGGGNVAWLPDPPDAAAWPDM